MTTTGEQYRLGELKALEGQMNLKTLIAKFKQPKDDKTENHRRIAELAGEELMRELAKEMGKPPDYQFSDEELCEIAGLPITEQPTE